MNERPQGDPVYTLEIPSTEQQLHEDRSRHYISVRNFLSAEIVDNNLYASLLQFSSKNHLGVVYYSI